MSSGKSWGGTVILYFVVQIVICSSRIPKLIIISMDGFRYNYLDRLQINETKHFQYFIQNGVKAEYVRNVFPTVTYPNHYTLITGLYPESHGIVHNRFYDSFWKEYFWMKSLRDNFDSFWYDDGAEPIYVTNDKAGPNRKSGSLLWPCGVAKVKGIAPDKFIPGQFWTSNMTFHDRVDLLMSWFTEEDPINLGLLYFSEPDELGHKFGPESDKVSDEIKGKLNDALGYLMQKLKAAGLLEEMNIILTADHGMSTVDMNKKVVLEDSSIQSDWFYTGSKDKNHITVEIFPTNESYLEPIYTALSKVPNLHVYRKNDSVLRDLHYTNNIRIAPLVITGKEGVTIHRNKSQASQFKVKGMHGYNPNEVKNMYPFFLAVGPAFKSGVKSGPFDSVDIYPLMCHILGIKPAPNNGSLDNVKHMLKDYETVEGANTVTAVSFLILIGISASVSGAFAICACHNARKPSRRLLVLNPEDRRTGQIPQSTTRQLLASDDDDDEF